MERRREEARAHARGLRSQVTAVTALAVSLTGSAGSKDHCQCQWGNGLGVACRLVPTDAGNKAATAVAFNFRLLSVVYG